MLWGEYNYDEDIAAQRQEAFDEGISQGIQHTKIECFPFLLYSSSLDTYIISYFINNVKNALYKLFKI